MLISVAGQLILSHCCLSKPAESCEKKAVENVTDANVTVRTKMKVNKIYDIFPVGEILTIYL
jgi:hypothetical protein